MNTHTANRMDLPAAYMDPAFMACVHKATGSAELISQFDRLHGADLSRRSTPIAQMVDVATGKSDEDIARFMRFIHDAIYMRLPDSDLIELRASADQIVSRDAS